MSRKNRSWRTLSTRSPRQPPDSARNPALDRIAALCDTNAAVQGNDIISNNNVKFGYVPALDGLRAMAVTAVICAHMGVPHLSGGRIGVYVFFALSGFLITRLLADEMQSGKIAVLQFYGRRAVRLLPAMWLLIFATIAYVWITPESRFYLASASTTLDGVIPSLLYYANWMWFLYGPDSIGILGHLWSLSVEEQFYLAWPLVLTVGLVRGRRLLIVLLGGICAVVLLGRMASYAGPTDNRYMFGTHLVADQLVFGSMAALAVMVDGQCVSRVLRTAFWPAVAFLVLVALRGDAWVTDQTSRTFYPVELTLVAAASAVVVTSLVLHPGWLGSALSLRPLVFLGRISYGMYLWHLLVIAALKDRTELAGAAFFIAVFCGTVAVASGSYFLLERPFISAFKGRFLRPRIA